MGAILSIVGIAISLLIFLISRRREGGLKGLCVNLDQTQSGDVVQKQGTDGFGFRSAPATV